MASLFTFNGNDLPEGVGITSFVISTPRVDFRTLNIPARRGDTRTGRKYGNRAVQMSVVLLGSTLIENAAILSNLFAWCQSDGPAPMIAHGGSSCLMVECDVFPHADLARPDEPFQIAFTAHSPDFVSTTESTAGALSSTFTVGGTLPIYPTITQTVSATLTDPTWTFNDGAYITLSGEIEAGALVIDCANEKVTLDGEDITASVSLGSTLGISLMPGQHSIAGSNGAAGTLKWRTATLWGY